MSAKVVCRDLCNSPDAALKLFVQMAPDLQAIAVGLPAESTLCVAAKVSGAEWETVVRALTPAELADILSKVLQPNGVERVLREVTGLREAGVPVVLIGEEWNVLVGWVERLERTLRPELSSS